MNNLQGRPALLRNVSTDSHHWVELKLIGTGRSNRDAIGARVLLHAGGVQQRGDVLCGGSFASSSDLRLFFGLGDAASVDGVEITWPDHTRQVLPPIAVDRIYTILEGSQPREAAPVRKRPRE